MREKYEMTMNCREKELETLKSKLKILAREDAPTAYEVNEVEIYLFLLKENMKDGDFFCKTTLIHELLAEISWKYKPQNNFNISLTNNND